MNLAFRHSSPPWEWLDMQENAFRRVRFGIAMEGLKLSQNPRSIFEGELEKLMVNLPQSQQNGRRLQGSTGKH